jgi:hypothetical protein
MEQVFIGAESKSIVSIPTAGEVDLEVKSSGIEWKTISLFILFGTLLPISIRFLRRRQNGLNKRKNSEDIGSIQMRKQYHTVNNSDDERRANNSNVVML